MYGRAVKSEVIMYSQRYCAVLAASMLSGTALAQAQPQSPASPGHHDSAQAHPGGARKSPYSGVGHSKQADLYYSSAWGVEQLRVQRTASGALIRFSYRVVDAQKAKSVHEKKAEPHLLGLRSHVMLSVPSLENVGALRQTEAITAGKDYWILFSNKGDLVKAGDRVDVIIGDFYANSLTVE
jgi:hypothetical protein